LGDRDGGGGGGVDVDKNSLVAEAGGGGGVNAEMISSANVNADMSSADCNDLRRYSAS
jgi:hypothetical protein